jgi:hypothetical protein
VRLQANRLFNGFDEDLRMLDLEGTTIAVKTQHDVGFASGASAQRSFHVGICLVMAATEATSSAESGEEGLKKVTPRIQTKH